MKKVVKVKAIVNFRGGYVPPKTLCVIVETEGFCAASAPAETDNIHPTSSSVEMEPWKNGGFQDLTF